MPSTNNENQNTLKEENLQLKLQLVRLKQELALELANNESLLQMINMISNHKPKNKLRCIPSSQYNQTFGYS